MGSVAIGSMDGRAHHGRTRIGIGAALAMDAGGFLADVYSDGFMEIQPFSSKRRGRQRDRRLQWSDRQLQRPRRATLEALLQPAYVTDLGGWQPPAVTITADSGFDYTNSVLEPHSALAALLALAGLRASRRERATRPRRP